ncbi:MAG: hypothetical protein ABSC06_18010 [Rhodopila sp.]|jgi:hypothetical protein
MPGSERAVVRADWRFTIDESWQGMRRILVMGLPGRARNLALVDSLGGWRIVLHGRGAMWRFMAE